MLTRIEGWAKTLRRPQRLRQHPDDHSLPGGLQKLCEGLDSVTVEVLILFLAGTSVRTLKHQFEDPEFALRMALRDPAYGALIKTLEGTS